MANSLVKNALCLRLKVYERGWVFVMRVESDEEDKATHQAGPVGSHGVYALEKLASTHRRGT